MERRNRLTQDGLGNRTNQSVNVAINWTLDNIAKYLNQQDIEEVTLLTEDLGTQLIYYEPYLNDRAKEILRLYHRALIYAEQSYNKWESE